MIEINYYNNNNFCKITKIFYIVGTYHCRYIIQTYVHRILLSFILFFLLFLNVVRCLFQGVRTVYFFIFHFSKENKNKK